MLEPLVHALAFRSASVEFLPSAHLEFDVAQPAARENCTLLLYDEAGLSGVIGTIMPLLCWGLLDALDRGGPTLATTFARALALMLRGEEGPPDADSVQGLWAELLVISAAADPSTLVRAWHDDPNDVYDFALGNERLEIKSARGSHRRHKFSSSQLPPRPGIELAIASVLVQRVAGGWTVADLIDDIRARTSPTVATELLQKAASVAPLSSFSGMEFDAVSAKQSIALVEGRAVPTIALSGGVLEANWVADLQGVPFGLQHLGPMARALGISRP